MKKLLLRVPEVALMFWIVKTLSTTVGETGADYLATHLGLGLSFTSLVMDGLLLVSLFIQLGLKRYVPTSYWTVVILMSVVGTLITDLLVDNFRVSLVTLTVIFTATMMAGFAVWYKKEKTLSIHSITTDKRERYYWLIILLAFALGTGAGDLISEGLDLGYGNALLIFASAIAVIAFAYFVLKMNAVLSFWLAFILTRPLGASLGDFLIAKVPDGGLGLGMIPVNIIFLSIIIILVGYMEIKQSKKVAELFI
ncbi:COG4705 family protein [Desulfobacula sp.]